LEERTRTLILKPGVADFVNSLFESIGAYGAWRNAYQLYKDKEIKGVYYPLYIFYFSWGVWNCIFYPSLGQWFSTVGGVILTLGNLAWVIMAIKLKLRRK
jgi:hypothetical protein